MSRRVNVFVRPRPLTPAEIKRGEQEGAMNVQSPAVHLKGGDSYGPFAVAFQPEVDNSEVFKHAVLPLVQVASVGKFAGCFCYGHTGSGKTHTVMGYRNEMGLYAHAGQSLFATMPPGLKLAIKVAEVYNEKVYDLVDGRSECFVKEGRDGVAHIRKPAEFGPNGSVRVRTLSSTVVANLEELATCVTAATKHRISGNSTLHAQSSRSHAMVEFELVTDELMGLREAALEAEAQLVPVGKERDNNVMEGPPPEMNEAEMALLESKFEMLQAEMKDLREAVDACIAKGQAQGLGGVIVFVDLAGSEHGEGCNSAKQTAAEKKERTQINASLLALKECIRSLHGNMSHVPFRNSKLTMLLRRYLMADHCTAAMVANVSGSTDQAKSSKNTLMYSQLVMEATKPATTKKPMTVLPQTTSNKKPMTVLPQTTSNKKPMTSKK